MTARTTPAVGALVLGLVATVLVTVLAPTGIPVWVLVVLGVIAVALETYALAVIVPIAAAEICDE